jgi:hypothetical protein
MWVVDATDLFATGVPVKCGVTIRAPHLRAPANFKYHDTARWTGFCILFEKFNRFYVTWVAHVFVFFCRFDFVAFRAHSVITNFAFPPSRQKSATRWKWTLANKLFTLRGRLLSSVSRGALLDLILFNARL